MNTELRSLVTSFKISSNNNYILENNNYSFQETVNKIPNQPNSFLSHLKKTLYRVYHCRQIDIPENPNFDFSYSEKLSQKLISLLSKSNNGKGTWDPGWRIMKIESEGSLIVFKNGLNLRVSPGSYFFTGKISTERKIHLWIPKENRVFQNGFYLAIGDTVIKEKHNDPIVRFYWHVGMDGAAILTKQLTAQLNSKGIPFEFKILNNPSLFTRCDSAVLYIRKTFFQECISSIVKIYNNSKNYLSSNTSIFTKKISKGLSVSEDPMNGESFGEHRAGLLAEALYSSKDQTSLSKLELVINHLENKGYDIDKLYLNPRSEDIFSIPVLERNLGS